MEQPQVTIAPGAIATLVILCALPKCKYGPAEAIRCVTVFF